MDSWSKIFFLFTFALMGGIFLASFGAGDIGLEILCVFIAVALLSSAWFGSQTARKIHILSGFVLVSLALGIVRFDLINDKKPSWLDGQAGEKITVEGVVAREPDVRDKEMRLTVAPDGASSRILVVVPRYPVYRYGDRIKITGKLQKPKNFILPSGATFDYETYLGKDDIYFQMYQPKISLLESGTGGWLTGKAIAVKSIFMTGLAGAFPEPESSYSAGLVLGAKRGLGKTIEDDFQRSGLSHVLVLSGYNVTIAAGSVANLLSFLPVMWGGVLSILFIIFFGLAAGGGATVWRASAMAIIAVYAKLSGRLYNVSAALLAAAALMLWFNPRLLVFDLSFQLSFLATLGVVYGAKIFNLWLAGFPEWFGLKETLCTTLGALVFVLPLILYKTGLLSVFAIPANLLILPLVPTTMALSFISSISYLIFGSLAMPVTFVVHLLLRAEIAIVHFVANLPLAAITVPPLPSWMIFIVYIVIFASVLAFYSKTEQVSCPT